MSPSASWAKWVMPIRIDPSDSPGLRTHSCSVVYFKSSGYNSSPPVGAVVGRLLRARRVGELRSGGGDDALDVQRLQLDDVDGGAVVLELVDRALGEDETAGQGGRLADHVDDVRRLELLPVDLDPADTVLERGLGDHTDLAVELHRLGPRRAELLDGVEHRVDVDRPV